MTQECEGVQVKIEGENTVKDADPKMEQYDDNLIVAMCTFESEDRRSYGQEGCLEGDQNSQVEEYRSRQWAREEGGEKKPTGLCHYYLTHNRADLKRCGDDWCKWRHELPHNQELEDRVIREIMNAMGRQAGRMKRRSPCVGRNLTRTNLQRLGLQVENEGSTKEGN